MTRLHGSCHCGDIQFRIDQTIETLIRCNCSICRRKAYTIGRITGEALTVTAGEDLLRVYQFHTHKARHFFCPRCGIHVFHQTRRDSNLYGVNTGCLTDFNTDNLSVTSFDGASLD